MSETPVEKQKYAKQGADKDNQFEISSKENEATQNTPQPEVIQPSRGSGILGGFCCQVDDVSMPTPKLRPGKQRKKALNC